MSHSDAIDAQNLIPVVVDRIVSAVHPAAIWLFGSQATGKALPDSDVDLLVVSADASTPLPDLAIRCRQATADIPVSQDIVATTLAQWQRRHDIPGTIERMACKEGRLLYGSC